MIDRYGQVAQFLPVLAPADITTTDTNTAIVDLSNAHRCTFLVYTGAVTSASTTEPVVTLMAATGAATVSATAIAFNYRKSSAVLTDTWADIAAATTAGMAITLTDDNKLMLIDVDPSVVASKTDGRYVYLHIDTNAQVSAFVIGASAILEPRYAANTMQSSS
jgi:hypothetical protein